MLHLFNRIYIEHEQWFNSQYENVILSSKEKFHPISRLAGVNIGSINSYEDYLKEHYGGEEEQFWQYLMKRTVDKTFVIYTDQILFDRLQIQFWKSIFEDQNPENHYKLYKFFFIDKKLKRFMAVEQKIKIPDFYERSKLMAFDEFKTLFESIPPIDDLMLMDKSGVSFEFLLANFFISPDSGMTTAFMKKLEDLSWKAFFDNIDILRNEILNSLYDIKQIIPEANIDFNDVDSVEAFILSEPKLKWVADPLFHARNREHVLKNYTKENFLDIFIGVAKCWVKTPNITDEELKNYLGYEDHIQITRCIFDNKFEELIGTSIAKNFGCIFVSDDLNNKANQILPLFIYDKVREKQLSEINFLKLR